MAVMLQAVQTRMFICLRTPGCFPAPEAVLSEVEQRFGCVQAQIHLQSEFGEEFLALILNRIPLLQVRGQTVKPTPPAGKIKMLSQSEVYYTQTTLMRICETSRRVSNIPVIA